MNQIRIFLEFIIVFTFISLFQQSCSASLARKCPTNKKEICDHYCYGEFVLATDTLKGFFKIHQDSIFFATLRKLNDLNRTYPSINQLPTAMYYIGNASVSFDTIELKRNSRDISFAHPDVLEFQTFIYPKSTIDEFHFSIRHAAISKSPSYRRSDRVFYFTEGQVCPDSIVSLTKEEYYFIYD